MRASRITAATAAIPLMLLGFAGAAMADNVRDDVASSGGSRSIATGDSTTVKYWIDANSAGSLTGCDASDGTPVTVGIVTPSGVSALPASLVFTSCGNATTNTKSVVFSSSTPGTYNITHTATDSVGVYNPNTANWTLTVNAPANTAPVVSVAGVSDGAEYVTGSVPTPTCEVSDAEDTNEAATPAVSGGAYDALGSHGVTCSYTDAGGLSDSDSVNYTVVPPPNTAPSVSVTGVRATTYEIGHVPAAGCDITDAEDGNSTEAAVLSGNLSHGLGDQTATCSYTDEGGLSDSDSVTYTIVDTGDPTITHTLSGPPANNNGWFNHNVDVDFTCDDGTGSGIQTCEGDVTLSEGADQSATGTATDWANNTSTDTVSNIDIDTTNPTVGFVGGPSGSYVFGSDSAAPTCDGADALSGIASCVIEGGGTTVGPHSYTATATDKAGNTATATLSYTVLAWGLKGFYQPVDMSGVWNTVKGGSTVPLKFEIFAGTTELTNTSAVDSFTVKGVSCPSGSAPTDDIELVTTGGTNLRYDSTGGQFIQNWQTPKKPGACYSVTMKTDDGSSISANFMLK